MNFLKFKSIIFSLIAVLAVTVLLISCEQETLSNLEEEVTIQKTELEVKQNLEERIPPPYYLAWEKRPTSIENYGNNMVARFYTNIPGIVVAQVFDCNWKQIGQHYHYIESGDGIQTFSPTAIGHCSKDNYVQVKLLDRNWRELTRLQTTVPKR